MFNEREGDGWGGWLSGCRWFDERGGGWGGWLSWCRGWFNVV